MSEQGPTQAQQQAAVRTVVSAIIALVGVLLLVGGLLAHKGPFAGVGGAVAVAGLLGWIAFRPRP